MVYTSVRMPSEQAVVDRYYWAYNSYYDRMYFEFKTVTGRSIDILCEKGKATTYVEAKKTSDTNSITAAYGQLAGIPNLSDEDTYVIACPLNGITESNMLLFSTLAQWSMPLEFCFMMYDTDTDTINWYSIYSWAHPLISDTQMDGTHNIYASWVKPNHKYIGLIPTLPNPVNIKS